MKTFAYTMIFFLCGSSLGFQTVYSKNAVFFIVFILQLQYYIIMNILKKILFVVLTIFFVFSCTGTPPASIDMTELFGKDWMLLEVRSSTGTVRIDRAAGGTGGIYTINFDAERISGIGAPNRYSFLYRAQTNGGLVIERGGISTRMAPLFEMRDLSEHDYFGYISRINRFELQNGTLFLFSSTDNGAETVLIFR